MAKRAKKKKAKWRMPQLFASAMAFASPIIWFADKILDVLVKSKNLGLW